MLNADAEYQSKVLSSMLTADDLAKVTSGITALTTSMVSGTSAIIALGTRLMQPLDDFVKAEF